MQPALIFKTTSLETRVTPFNISGGVLLAVSVLSCPFDETARLLTECEYDEFPKNSEGCVPDPNDDTFRDSADDTAISACLLLQAVSNTIIVHKNAILRMNFGIYSHNLNTRYFKKVYILQEDYTTILLSAFLR